MATNKNNGIILGATYQLPGGPATKPSLGRPGFTLIELLVVLIIIASFVCMGLVIRCGFRASVEIKDKGLKTTFSEVWNGTNAEQPPAK